MASARHARGSSSPPSHTNPMQSFGGTLAPRRFASVTYGVVRYTGTTSSVRYLGTDPCGLDSSFLPLTWTRRLCATDITIRVGESLEVHLTTAKQTIDTFRKRCRSCSNHWLLGCHERWNFA
eukprot:8188-Pyramimonas_sp.AAC.2